MKILEKIENWVIYAIYGVFILTLLNTCNSCGTKREITRLKKEVDSLRYSTYSKKELDLKMEINGLKTSKRTLYDWNSIVRTVVRPDDRMNEYDKEILKLEKELNKLKNKNNE